ncbi:MAG: magnesium transporter [Proteobacteria bacterium]|nr:magnesium transporter [Pseudomonadota bacterium]
MSESEQEPEGVEQQLQVLIDQEDHHKILDLLEILKTPDIGHLITASPPRQRMLLWNLFSEEQQSDIIQYVDEDIVSDLLESKTPIEIANVLEHVDSDDDVTDILQQLPDVIMVEVLRSMREQDRERVETLLSYPDDTAGGLMSTDIISVRAAVTVDVVLRYLRRHTELPPMTDSIFVVNRHDILVGSLPLSSLLVADPNTTVRDVMSIDVEPIVDTMPEDEIAGLFERFDLVSAPVVDEQGKLLGRITVDDVVDVIIEQADHSILAMAGLAQDEDTFAPIMKTARSRAFWLGTNLVTAFIASAVINLFEGTIAKVVALAVLMPIVASMGGVAGSQTLTLVIRNMALGHVMEGNKRWLLNRELAVGALNGVFWALVVAVVAALVFNDPLLGLIIAIALVINMIVAALTGVLLPGVLKSMGIDPAIAGTVVLTTVTDVVGFMSFLGLATYFYM